MMMKRIASIIVIIVTFLVIEVNALNKSVIDVTKLTMSQTIDYLDKGVITSEELVNLYLDRINTYNNDFKAIITINPNIIEEAKESDELRKNNTKRGILEGIPIIVKDNIDVKGMPTTAGAKVLEDNYPNDDAEVIKKLKNEGALIIAKANMSEFAFSAKDSYSSYGYVSNAYKLGYTSYGSSGGSAVSVALNFGSVALGTDTNSSVRLPAAGAGLVGLRPTTGKVSTTGVINYDINRDTIGIISKSVLDNKIIWGVITNEKYDYVDDSKKIRIGIPKSFYEGEEKTNLKANKTTIGFIKEMLDAEINRLNNENVELVYLDEVYNNTFARYNNISIAGYTMCRAFNNYINNTTGTIRNFNQLTNSKGKVASLGGYNRSCNYTDNNYNKTLSNLALAKKYIENIYNQNELDFMLYPTTKNEIYSKGNNQLLVNVSGTMSSVVGYPSITIPLGYYADMPYGIEIMGRENKEMELYNLAEIMEKHNNLINSHDSAAARLYEVPMEVNNLVNLYLNDYESSSDWLDNVRNYFRSYNGMENEKDISLDLINSKEVKKEEKEVIIKKINNNYLIGDIYVYFFISLACMGIFLYVPKVTLGMFKKRKENIERT